MPATPAGPDVSASQIAAFVDNVNAGPPIYLDSVQDYNPPTPLDEGRNADLTIARALLTGGTQRWRTRAGSDRRAHQAVG